MNNDRGDFMLGPRARPRWLVRHGIWSMTLSLAALLALSALVPYSEAVTVTFRTPSSTVISPRPGRIRLLKNEGDRVRAGETIAEIDALDEQAGASAIVVLPARALRGMNIPAPIMASFSTNRETVMSAGVITRVFTSGPNVRAVVSFRHAPAGSQGTIGVRTQERLLDHILRLAKWK